MIGFALGTPARACIDINKTPSPFRLLRSIAGARGADAASLLEASKHALDQYESYQYRYTFTMESDPPPFITSSLISVSKSGKMGVDSTRQPFGSGIVVQYDGRTALAYRTEQNVYIQEEGKSGLEGLLAAARSGGWRLPAGTEFSPATVREEFLEVDGEQRECWVIERTVSEPWPSPVQPEKRWVAQFTTWIDKALGIDWQVVEIHKTLGEQLRRSVRKNGT